MNAPMPPPRGPAPASTPPREIRNAVVLFAAQAVLVAVAAVLTYLLSSELVRGQLDRSLRSSGGPARQRVPPGIAAFAGSLANGVLVTLLVITLLIVVVEVVLLVFLRRGRNWARVVLTVLAGLGLLGFLTSLNGISRSFAAGSLGVIASVLQIIGALLLIAAIVLMYQRDANTWFRANAAPPPGPMAYPAG